MDKNLESGYYQLVCAIFQEEEIRMIDSNSLKQTIDEFIAILKPNDQQVLKMRFGLSDGEQKTLQQIGDILGVTRERIRQLERRALRRLKHPTRANKLRQYIKG